MSTEYRNWPRIWGGSWLLVAAVAVAVDFAMYAWWPAGFETFDGLLLTVAWLCIIRAAYWHGYNKGRDSSEAARTPDGRR